MNVGFPEAQDRIATLGKVGITRLITGGVCLLDRVGEIGIQRRVAMPEVAIPLNDDALIRQQNVNHELATNYLLLKVVDAKPIKDSVTSRLKRVRILLCRKAQDAVNPLHIDFVVAASVGAILDGLPFQSPSGDIERLATGNAALNSPAAIDADCLAPRCFFGSTSVLPSVCAVERAECHGATATGDKCLAAVAAGIGTARIAPFSKVGTRQKRLAAFIAQFRLAGDVVVHDALIPWSVAKCNWN